MRRIARLVAVVGMGWSLTAEVAAGQAGRTIRGVVTNAHDSTAIVGAIVRVVGGPLTHASTDDSGRFVLHAPSMGVRLMTARVGFAPDTSSVAVDQAELRIRLVPSVVQLAPVAVTGRADDLIGIATSASQGRVGSIDLKSRPISREGELLETVPGVIVTQHSGDGKANQYFIRGFNLDHGTDFQTRVDGMPINLPSHAHGQGYTDLNFMIPELVDYIDYQLGVYHTELGDFGSAGGAEFHFKKSLAEPFGSIGTGENGLVRALGAGSTQLGSGELMGGLEVKHYNGPWTLAEDLRKVSGILRYSWQRGTSEFSVLALGYHNRWNSTDQIPERAVTAGLIPRLGNLDPTDGGNTERYSLSGTWRRIGARSIDEAQLFGIHSDLSLFSDFEFFLNDPVRGDQFNQRERRTVLGGRYVHRQLLDAGGTSHWLKVGLETRADLIDGLGLYHTEARNRIGTVRQDDVREWGSGAFAELETRWRPWVRTVLGVRGDFYTFDVDGDRPENAGHRTAGIVSPKASVVFTLSPGSELYVSGGLGFHSNDARGTTITVDPSTGAPANRVDPLVRSRGAEVGLRVTPVPEWRSTVSVWGLSLDGELLFVGDAGITEPSSPSRRIGLTFANFYRPMPQLALDVDLSLAKARFAGVGPGQDRIPGAIENVLSAGIAWNEVKKGAFASVRVRHFGSYPLIEDNSVRATPNTLVGVQAGYRLAIGLRLEAGVLNLLNSAANDIQYYYASRLQGEPAGGIDDVHFHPAEPRQFRVTVSWGF